MNTLVQKCIRGGTAVKIAESIEAAVRDGKMRAGERLPTIRDLSGQLGVSPATVAAGYQALQARGVVQAQGRRGTRISHRPVHPLCRRAVVPAGTRNLADGNPDPALLPPIDRILARIDSRPRLYGEAQQDAGLVALAARDLARCGVAAGGICVVNGAMDGIERILTEHLRCGDRVAVEDPGFGNMFDLVISRGLALLPVPVDEEGLLPEGLGRAVAEGAKAVIVTPRAHNPTGAVLSQERAKELRRVLRKAPDVLIIEDDHAGLITDAPLHCLHDARRPRWAHVRSFSKSLNPDLRLAVLTGDNTTMTRVQDRLLVGERWVSHLLQRIGYGLLADAAVRSHLNNVARIYGERRGALVGALKRAGLPAAGRSGYNVWVPVLEETTTVQTLAAVGWAVAAGERFRLNAPPAIRITAATLLPEEADRLAGDVASILARPGVSVTV